MAIKPIETEYKGYKFRSRLEARWAVFFDALGVQYEYEPEGFNLGNDLYYLPDFLLYNVITRYAQGDAHIDLYVEVKGKPNEKDALKIHEFSKTYPIWVVGNIPDPTDYVSSCEKQRREYCNKVCNGTYDFPNKCVFCPYDHGTIDGDNCFAFSIGYDCNTLSFHGADSNYGYGSYYSEIEHAFKKARQARFEYSDKKGVM